MLIQLQEHKQCQVLILGDEVRRSVQALNLFHSTLEKPCPSWTLPANLWQQFVEEPHMGVMVR